MRVSPKGLLALRGWVIAAVVVGWNGLFILGLALNGFRGRIDESSPLTARACLATATLGAATLCLAMLTSKRARAALTAPDRRHIYAPDPYVLILMITGFLGLFFIFGF